MHKHVLLEINIRIKNEKTLKEVSRSAGERTIVTILNAINKRDAQASIRADVHLDKLTEKRSKSLENAPKTLEDYDIDYDEVIIRDNAKGELLEPVNSGRYEIIVLSNRKAEDNKKFVLGSASHKVAKRATIPVLVVK